MINFLLESELSLSFFTLYAFYVARAEMRVLKCSIYRNSAFPSPLPNLVNLALLLQKMASHPDKYIRMGPQAVQGQPSQTMKPNVWSVQRSKIDKINTTNIPQISGAGLSFHLKSE